MGQQLAIVEAMKMQNVLRAERKGLYHINMHYNLLFHCEATQLYNSLCRDCESCEKTCG